jgi:hypothetical protein
MIAIANVRWKDAKSGRALEVDQQRSASATMASRRMAASSAFATRVLW